MRFLKNWLRAVGFFGGSIGVVAILGGIGYLFVHMPWAFGAYMFFLVTCAMAGLMTLEEYRPR